MLTSGMVWDLIREMFDGIYHDQRDEKWVAQAQRSSKKCRDHCSDESSETAAYLDIICGCQDKQELKRYVNIPNKRQSPDHGPGSMSSTSSSLVQSSADATVTSDSGSTDGSAGTSGTDDQSESTTSSPSGRRARLYAAVLRAD